MKRNKEFYGTLLAVCTAIISGVAIFANKIFIVDMDPTIFTAVRAIFIGIIFFVISSVQVKFDYKKFKKIPWKYLLVIGIIGGGVAFLMFFTGLKFTTGGRAAFLHKTLPLYTTLLAFVFLKERITQKQLTALIFMFIGTIVLYSAVITPTEMWLNPGLGDLLIIGATIFWGIENVVAKKAMMLKESNLVVGFGRMFFGALILFGVVLLTGKLDLLFTLQPHQTANLLISTAILFGFVLTYYWSLKYINVSKASSILLLAPVITLLLGVGFLGEPAPAVQLAGSAIILIGAYLILGVKSEHRFGFGLKKKEFRLEKEI
ncbi:MAG: EamA family transporter [Candidatus Aenigmatarchaeota archaeon]|nr:EamA family transporter [Nanoarchaeota archaeon]